MNAKELCERAIAQPELVRRAAMNGEYVAGLQLVQEQATREPAIAKLLLKAMAVVEAARRSLPAIDRCDSEIAEFGKVVSEEYSGALSDRVVAIAEALSEFDRAAKGMETK